MELTKIDQFTKLSRRIKTHEQYMRLWNYADYSDCSDMLFEILEDGLEISGFIPDSISYFKFATDSEHGFIAAGSFRTAKVYLESMLPNDARRHGAWGWVDNGEGTRYEIWSLCE
jgi:hypothetical protein